MRASTTPTTSAQLGANACSRVVNRNTPALTRMSHFTALVKGGKLSVKVRPRYMKDRSWWPVLVVSRRVADAWPAQFGACKQFYQVTRRSKLRLYCSFTLASSFRQQHRS